MRLGRSGDQLPAEVPLVSLTVVRVVRERHRGFGRTERVFEALVWDPTAVHEVIAEVKRHPVAALLIPRADGS